METSDKNYRDRKEGSRQKERSPADGELRAIAYSMDALIPGFYCWFGSLKIRLGGSDAEENYRGKINSFAGIALVLPNYRIFSTYQGSYDP